MFHPPFLPLMRQPMPLLHTPPQSETQKSLCEQMHDTAVLGHQCYIELSPHRQSERILAHEHDSQKHTCMSPPYNEPLPT